MAHPWKLMTFIQEKPRCHRPQSLRNNTHWQWDNNTAATPQMPGDCVESTAVEIDLTFPSRAAPLSLASLASEAQACQACSISLLSNPSTPQH